MKAHNTRKHAGYEANYEEVLLEKEKIIIAMVKLQSEKDILLAKVSAFENSEAAEYEADECVANVQCEGDCEHVRCNIDEAQRLNNMKNQGGRRRSPSKQACPSPWTYCPQCNFKTRNKNELKNHVKEMHDQNPSCPFCLIGFTNQGALMKHVEQSHGENTPVI